MLKSLPARSAATTDDISFRGQFPPRANLVARTVVGPASMAAQRLELRRVIAGSRNLDQRRFRRSLNSCILDDRRRQSAQPEQFVYGNARLAEYFGRVGLAVAVLLNEPRNGAVFVDRGEVFALNVLDERQLVHIERHIEELRAELQATGGAEEARDIQRELDAMLRRVSDLAREGQEPMSVASTEVV